MTRSLDLSNVFHEGYSSLGRKSDDEGEECEDGGVDSRESTGEAGERRRSLRCWAVMDMVEYEPGARFGWWGPR